MPVDIDTIDKYLPSLPTELRTEISGFADCFSIPKGISLLHQGQYVRVIPVVLEGLSRCSPGWRKRNCCFTISNPLKAV
jgi:hypothetical protein